ncbi:MAG: molybdopterin-binding protein [Actinomycetota bacterium]|jgi:molybdopterin molybdotransferase|nr:molybdopterin-binding protein [Actinomycetota bacterium]MDA2997893.1 molybdopterin-binding protein [Actinomycetota bacterium]MDA3036729.1 molybdopterin-binding protein [Actinomycetota bacterium]
MEETLSVAQMYERLLELATPLAALDLPLLDAHGATMASDLLLDEKVAIKSGTKINSTQIALAASLGLDRLPCRPHPRVVIISAGDDLVEPGSKLADEDDEFESNSWFLTTFMKETGAHAFRVHTIPETSEELKLIVEDQLVRADLIVISGESGDESFELINSVLSQLGQMTTIIPNLAESGKHNYGVIGPDKTPIVTLPGDPIGNFLSAEIFIRPMVLKMLAMSEINRATKKLKLNKDINPVQEKANYIRGKINSDGSVEPLENQELISTLSLADCLITLGEKDKKLSAGDSVNVIMINQG